MEHIGKKAAPILILKVLAEYSDESHYLTQQEIIDMVLRMQDKKMAIQCTNEDRKDEQVALHEAGHIFIAYHFRKYFDFVYASIRRDLENEMTGTTQVRIKKEWKRYVFVRKKYTMLACAGDTACRLFGHRRVLGCEADFKNETDRLLSDLDDKGVYGPKWLYRTIWRGSQWQRPSEWILRKRDAKVNRIFFKAQIKTFLVLLVNRRKVLKIARYLNAKGFLYVDELSKILE